MMGSRMKHLREMEKQGQTYVTELVLNKKGSVGFELAPLGETCGVFLFDIPKNSQIGPPSTQRN